MFIGAKVNLIPIFSSLNNLAILFTMLAVGILSKVVGVTVASKFSGLKMKQSLAFGFFHTARLSLIIAAIDISLKLKLIDDNLFAILIILAIVSAIMATSLGRHILARE
ncbi:MAG: cation:proton antiporter [Dehalococcoidia bacterium]